MAQNWNSETFGAAGNLRLHRAAFSELSLADAQRITAD
jgi:hypothetical protein